jgi:outer membrane protein assembly factor BamA
LGPKVKVIRLKFQTPVPLTPPERQKLIASLRVVGWKFGQEQTSEFTKDTAEELAREAYQDKGYFKAEVAAELISIRAQDSNAVAVILQVTPGRQYHLASLSWRGMSAFSESELEKLIPTQVGEVFNRTKIASGLETVKKLYDSRGYINFTSVPTPQVDDAEGTVSFEIDIDEGGQFHFGKLDVEGMQEAHRRILLSAWEGLHGKPYNEEKANRFFERFFRSPLPNITPEDYTTHNIDEHSRSVDYSLQLLPSLRYR